MFSNLVFISYLADKKEIINGIKRLETMITIVAKDKRIENIDPQMNASFLNINKDKDLKQFPLNEMQEFELNEVRLLQDSQFQLKVVSMIIYMIF